MKIVFFACETRKIAAIRYRIESFARLLEQEGHECVVCVPAPVRMKERLYESSGRFGKLLYLILVLLGRIVQLRHVFSADVDFFRGPVFPYGPPVFERIIHFLNKHLVMDLDDAIWERPAFVSSPFVRFMDFDWTAKMAKLCCHAVAGNAVIKAYVEDAGCPATIIPTCIDMELHRAKTYEADPDRPVVLGWTGLSDNLGYVDRIAPVIRALADKSRNCDLHGEAVFLPGHQRTKPGVDHERGNRLSYGSGHRVDAARGHAPRPGQVRVQGAAVHGCGNAGGPVAGGYEP